MFGSGEVVCVQASGLHGRGFESSVMPKDKLFLAIFRFLLVFVGIYPQLQSFYGIILITHAYGEDPSVLSSLSPILPSSSEDLRFISPVICLLLRSVVHCLTLIPLFAG